jgi:hypothetical protein
LRLDEGLVENVMETVADLVIHVGFRKTATSWLQEVLFPVLRLNYIGKTEAFYPEWLIEWHYADDFYFEQKKSRIRNELLSRLCEDRCNLLSSEAFTNSASIHSQAHRIRTVWPDARILVTLRDPVEMVWSHYRHDIQEGDCFVDIESWLDWRRTPYVLHKRKTIYLPDFFFDEAIHLYEELFGPKNVCVLKYEDMRSSREVYFSRLFEFLGVDDELPSAAFLARMVNESPKEVESLEKLKRMNLGRFLQTHFPDLSITEAENPEKGGRTRDMLTGDTDLRNRLVEYFKGRSYGYY